MAEEAYGFDKVDARRILKATERVERTLVGHSGGGNGPGRGFPVYKKKWYRIVSNAGGGAYTARLQEWIPDAPGVPAHLSDISDAHHPEYNLNQAAWDCRGYAGAAVNARVQGWKVWVNGEWYLVLDCLPLGDANPVAVDPATAAPAPGVATAASREDHVHTHAAATLAIVSDYRWYGFDAALTEMPAGPYVSVQQYADILDGKGHSQVGVVVGATGYIGITIPEGSLYHALLSNTHSDTTPAAVTRGATITGQGADPDTTWAILAAGTPGQVFTMGAAEPEWADLPDYSSYFYKVKVQALDDEAQYLHDKLPNNAGDANTIPVAWTELDAAGVKSLRLDIAKADVAAAAGGFTVHEKKLHYTGTGANTTVVVNLDTRTIAGLCGWRVSFTSAADLQTTTLMRTLTPFEDSAAVPLDLTFNGLHSAVRFYVDVADGHKLKVAFSNDGTDEDAWVWIKFLQTGTAPADGFTDV
jgi:hypothetical protein